MAFPDRPVIGISQSEGVKFLSRLVPTGVVLPGTINNLEQVTDQKSIYVRKTRDESKLPEMMKFYNQVEFPAVLFGGSVRGRTYREQAVHMLEAVRLGIPASIPVYVDDQTLITQYVPGISLREHLIQGGDNRVIDNVLGTLAHAHNNDFILGDRHPGNMVLKPNGELVQIDFDNDLTGRNAKEYEMAMFIYRALGLTSQFDHALGRVSKFAKDHSNQYDWQLITSFIQRYQQFINEHQDINRKINLGDKLGVVTSALTSAN